MTFSSVKEMFPEGMSSRDQGEMMKPMAEGSEENREEVNTRTHGEGGRRSNFGILVMEILTCHYDVRLSSSGRLVVMHLSMDAGVTIMRATLLNPLFSWAGGIYSVTYCVF